MELQRRMNDVIALLIKHTKAYERGTNIINGIKAVYRRIHNVQGLGAARAAVASPLSKVSEQTKEGN